MAKERDRLLFERLKHHLAARTDPCQDRGADWPCDVAEALGFGPESPVEPRTGGSAWERMPETGTEALRAIPVALTPEQAHALDPTHEWHPGDGCPVCAREAAERRYGHLTSDERQVLARLARKEAEHWADPTKPPFPGRSAPNERAVRVMRWRDIANELYPDTTEVRS